jgi:uncharacterized protein YlxW (UPF0749 family)
MRTKRNTKSILWMIALTVVLFCFGILLMAQYYTHQANSSSLENESSANLALIIKSLNNNKEDLAEELQLLEQQLAETEDLVASGESLSTSIRNRIEKLQIVTGYKQVTGSGITVTITGDSNLMYYDLIDLVNELFVSGAEAVSINETRCTIHTSISEKAVLADAYDDAGKSYKEETYVPLINGKEILYPIVIKAIGNPSTLETGLTYPGGIIESLNSLYMVYPIIKQVDNLIIPAAATYEYEYAEIPASENQESGT